MVGGTILVHFVLSVCFVKRWNRVRHGDVLLWCNVSFSGIFRRIASFNCKCFYSREIKKYQKICSGWHAARLIVPVKRQSKNKDCKMKSSFKTEKFDSVKRSRSKPLTMAALLMLKEVEK